MTEAEPDSIGRRNSDLIIVKLDGQVTDIAKKVDKLVGWFEGDGTADNPGVIVRLDRLERAEDERKRQRLVIYTSIMGLIIERGFHYISLLRGLGGNG